MIVLAVTPSGEANNVYTLLTRELGIVRAKAQSVRKLASKLRFGLQYLSYGTVDLIRAKDTWRIVGVAGESTLLPADIRHKPLHRMVSLLQRIVPADERNSDLYDALVSASDLFAQHQDTHHHTAIELLSVARILSLCGYWDDELPIHNTAMVTVDELSNVLGKQKAYLTAINTALRHTHL